MTEFALQTLRERLNRVIDDAQTASDGRRIASAGELLSRLDDVRRDIAEVAEAIAGLEDDARVVAEHENDASEARLRSRPSSFLLLPAAGPGSSRHFEATVAGRVDAERLEDWCPRDSQTVRSRVTNGLAVWGLRDNTRGFPSQGVEPISWKRIAAGTLAMFSDSTEYFCAAAVIGKCVSDRASIALWESPEFRWIILMSDVRTISVPLQVVINAAGFDPTFKINREALVPRQHREDALWDALCAHGVGRVVEPRLNAT